MMEEKEILKSFADLQRTTLLVWIERGWVSPQRTRSGYRFREIDVARVRLIYEFTTELELDDEAMDVVLPLIDQVHGLRHQLRCLADAVNSQPTDVRKAIAETLKNDKEGI